MSILKESRNRTGVGSHIISFRLADDTYRELIRTCEETQVGTPSELVRTMVCALLSSSGDTNELALSFVLKKLDGSMTDLKRELEKLTDRIHLPD